MFGLDCMTIWRRPLTDFEVTTIFNDFTGLEFPFLGGPFSLIFQANLINDPDKPVVLGSGFQLWSATPLFDGDTGVFTLNMDLLFSGNPSSRGFAWTAENFFDKVLFAQHDNVVQYWNPPLPNLALPIPGLPVNDDMWDGVTVFFDHVVLWKSDRLKWSDRNDFTLWIPVDRTIVSTILTITDDFVQPAPGGTVTVTVSDPVTEVISISLSGDLDFGSVPVGTSDDTVLTITNSGTVPLVVSGISLPAGFSGSFSGTIPVNGSVPVIITFSPEEAIDYDGVITVASNATFGSGSIPVTGSGSGTTRLISLGGVLAFSNVVIGRSLVSSLTIENFGNANLTVTSITLPSGFSGSFAGVIAAGDRQIVPITFTPSAVLNYGGNISVASDATGGTSTIPISGAGRSSITNRIFLTDNGSLQFGDVPTGTTPTGTLRIYNVSSSHTQRVVGISLPGGYTGSFVGNIAANSFQDVTITFSPVDGIDYNGVITVAIQNTNAGGTKTLAVSGTGVESGKVISLSGSLDFGEVFLNTSVGSILKISNIGDTPLTVTSLAYPSGFSGAFAGTIAPGGFKNVLVTFQPTLAIDYTGNVTVTSDADSGTPTRALSGTGVEIPVPTSLQVGQFVAIADGNGGFNYYTVVSMTGASVVLQLLDLTGITAPGTVITAGNQIFSVDANEAGETRVVGSVNGPIFRVLPQGDYAYIFKERSISSMQYTGLGNGTFFIHPEVSGEGMISRNAICNINDGRIVFLGHKELYSYNGGPNPVAVCQQTIRQLYRELDRTRLHQILLFNNEQVNEVWVSYPTIGGGFRVMIWNYVEDTASFDDYDQTLVFSAFGLVDWSGDPSWGSLPDSLTWNSIDPGITWDDMTGASIDHLAVMASEDGQIRVWGTRYAREGAGYLTLSESMDFDLGDGDAWKYVDAVKLGLNIRVPEDTSRLMYIQVGCRADLNNAEITWTAPISILVNGHATTPVKVNPGGAGRYMRVRFYAQDPDVQWAVSSFEILARMGGTY